jgi:hypothetical protein
LLLYGLGSRSVLVGLVRVGLRGKLLALQSLLRIDHVAHNKRLPLLREPYLAVTDCPGSPTPHHHGTAQLSHGPLNVPRPHHAGTSPLSGLV